MQLVEVLAELVEQLVEQVVDTVDRRAGVLAVEEVEGNIGGMAEWDIVVLVGDTPAEGNGMEGVIEPLKVSDLPFPSIRLS